MNTQHLITGGSGGGGKSGSGGGISEDPDNLQSVAQARFVDLIGEGPIVGLVNGEYSIYVDDVPLRDLAGTPNYRPFQWQAVNGSPIQGVIPGFAGTQSENPVSLKILQTQGKVVRSVSDADADSVRVTVSVQGLTQTTDKGEIHGSNVTYKIWVRIVGGSWVLGVDGNITGKTTAKYQRSHEVNLSSLGVGPYEVAVERIKADSTSSLLVDGLYWDTYTVINYEQLTYPYTAAVGVALDARYFANVPKRSYHVRGLLVKMPTNYDPVTRKYTGTWDGTWKTDWTNNPAWCFYNLVTNPRYGLGDRISESQISKWEVYKIAQYCDEMVVSDFTSNVMEIQEGGTYSAGGSLSASVPVHKGPLEPRFTLNVVINTRDDAYKVLNNLASVFRGMVYWSAGQVTLTQDRPTDVSMLWTNANVIDGSFTYAGSSREQRHTTITVAWNDPLEGFKQKYEYIEDRAGIARYGVRSTEMVAFGCTSRSQARRTGLYLLYTERLEKDTITFRVGLDSAFIKPGMVGKILDSNRFGARWGGRIASATTTSITLDSAVTLTAGPYTLSVMRKDGTVMSGTATVPAGGSYSTLDLDAPLPEAPATMAIWTLASAAAAPMTVRVVGVRPVSGQKGQYEITCLQHEPGKYAAIDNGAGFALQNYSFLSFTKVPTVTGLFVRENSFKPTVTSSVVTNVDISWDKASDPLVRGYRVKMISTDRVIDLQEIKDPSCTVHDVLPDTYTVSVISVNHLGLLSDAVTLDVTITGVDTTPPADVTGFTYSLDAANGLTLSWQAVNDYIDYYEIRKGSSWDSFTSTKKVKATSLLLGSLSAGAQTHWIKAIDTSGNASVNAASLTFTVLAPSAPTLGYSIVGPDEYLTWTIPSSDLKIDRFEIWVGNTFETSIFVDSTKSTGYRRKVDYVGSTTYWVFAIDVMENIGSPASVVTTIIGPGPVTSSRSEVVDNNVLLRWAEPLTGNLPVQDYEVRKGATWETGTVVGHNGNSTFAAVFEQQSGVYSYWIAAVDSAGNVGPAVAISATVSQPPDYVLRADYNDDFTGTLSGMSVEDGVVFGPTLNETIQQHFESRGWTSIDDQMNAGYPLVFEPGGTSGYYERVLDYFDGAPENGTNLLSSTTVTVTPSVNVLAGSVSTNVQISYKATAAGAWIDAASGATQVLASGFRYSKVRVTFTADGGGNDLAEMTKLNIKLSSKQRTDAGSGTANAGDSGGTYVPFNVAFIDVTSITPAAGGTTARYALYSFTGVPNPTGFYVLLFDNNGNRVSGPFSWTARGF